MLNKTLLRPIKYFLHVYQWRCVLSVYIFLNIYTTRGHFLYIKGNSNHCTTCQSIKIYHFINSYYHVSYFKSEKKSIDKRSSIIYGSLLLFDGISARLFPCVTPSMALLFLCVAPKCSLPSIFSSMHHSEKARSHHLGAQVLSVKASLGTGILG